MIGSPLKASDVDQSRNASTTSVGRRPSRNNLTMPSTLRESILALYRQVDAEVAAAGPVCQASGRCCRFREYGHTLFLSKMEAEVLLADAPPITTPVDA